MTTLLRTVVHVEGNEPVELFEVEVPNLERFQAAIADYKARGHTVDRDGDKYTTTSPDGKFRVVYLLTTIT
jgi:hypothetical protein